VVDGLNSYDLTITAPYMNNGSAVAQNVYLGFVNNEAIMSPSTAYSATTSTASNGTTGLVPVTLTLPESGGAPQANQEVTFVLSSTTNGDLTGSNSYTNTNSTSSYFANNSGANISSNYVTTYTNAEGQATVWVNDYNPENVFVTAFSGGYPLSSDTALATTELEYSDANAPTESLSSIGVGAFAPSANFTPSATSLSGLAGNQAAYFVPLDSSGTELTGSNAEATYNLSVSNGAEISEIDGMPLPAEVGTPSSLQLELTGTGTNNNGATTYTWTVDGLTFATTTNPYFWVTLTNESAASTLTVTSGSAKSTATFNVAQSASYVSTLSPSQITLNDFSGQSAPVTFTVLDASGNPVADSTAVVKFDNTSSHVWVTQVNGTTLAENIGSNDSLVDTPIPLFNTSDTLAYASSGFSMPGVASWTGTSSKQFTVFTNSNGQVTLTLQSGNVEYAEGTNGNATNMVSGSQTNTSSYTYAFTYGDGNTGNHAVLYFGAPGSVSVTNPTGNTNWGGNGYQVGSISW
jgi:hypothetical protein